MPKPNIKNYEKHVSFFDQLNDKGDGQIVLINIFTVPSEAIDAFLANWAAESKVMMRQPGFVSAQLHQGLAGSETFTNYAVWRSIADMRAAFHNPEFQSAIDKTPAGIDAVPLLVRKVAVSGVCEA
jgi:heme-degrading monooxygenase HmoA